LIHSGSQTKVVADPNFNVTPGIQADAVTISNDHFTHNNTGAVTGNPVILRGITFKQTWQPIRTSVKDITIVNIPSQRSANWGAIANSIFVYEMGSLCLAHLGNIGHLLTEEQVKGDLINYRHEHYFKQVDNGTIMIDIVEYDLPKDLIGKWAGKFFLREYLEKIIKNRILVIKNYAETERWHALLG
jgi:hypothetical protein